MVGIGSVFETTLLCTAPGELVAVTWAWFEIWKVPAGGVPTVTVNVTLTVVLPGRSPSCQVTTPPAAPQVVLAGVVHVPKAVPTGSGSLITTPCAVTFDSLLTVSV